MLFVGHMHTQCTVYACEAVGSPYKSLTVTVTRRGGAENDTVEYVHMAGPQAGVSSLPKGGRRGLGGKGFLCGEAIRGPT
jgi:hypothetical protein